MAIKSTIFKVNLQIADIDHGYYADHNMTLARHPSETDDRMMVRLVALALNAWQLQALCNGDGTLSFGVGLSDPDDPDVHITDYTGQKRLWIEVGQPEDKPISKACNKSDHVLVYPFSSAASIWWKGIEGKVNRQSKLQVLEGKKHGASPHDGQRRAIKSGRKRRETQHPLRLLRLRVFLRERGNRIACARNGQINARKRFCFALSY